MEELLLPDSTLSHYRIVSRIGVGGMGEVYAAEDTRLDRRVALKFLNEEFSKHSDKLKRFVQEAWARKTKPSPTSKKTLRNGHPLSVGFH